jgi:Rps23 Pro-64 3,4-dihydroxylase Tpa1-like proline 4-hydroxylase
LVQFAQSNEARFEDTKVMHGRTATVDLARRVSKKLSLGDLKAEVIASVDELLPFMFEVLGINHFKPSKIETELIAHGDGAFFGRHIDDGRVVGSRRIISAVYYFHALPKAFSGGALRLHSLATSDQQRAVVDIEPDYDTLVFFPSVFPHEVLPVKCPSLQFSDSRFSINIWIRRG